MTEQTRGADRTARRTKSLRPLRGLIPFLKPYRFLIMLALFALLLAAGMTLSIPVAFRRVLDLGLLASDDASIGQHFLWLLGIAVMLAVFSSIRFYLVSRIGERVVADLRSAVFEHLLKMTPSFFEVTRTGEVLSRLTTDTTLIQTVIGSSLSIALRSSVTLIGGLVMLTITSPKLSAIIIVLLPAVLAPIILVGKRVRRLSRDSQDRIADTSAVAGEILGAMPVVQAFTLEHLQHSRFSDAVEQSFSAAERRIRTRSLLTASGIGLVFSAIIAVLWIGTLDVLAGDMTGGELGQFMFYAIIVGGSASFIGEIWGSLQQAAGATERLVELLETEPQIAAPASPVPLPSPSRGHLTFENVSFNYPTRPEQLALSRFSLDIAPREMVALVGPSGAGKTTVFQLLLSFYRPNSGTIRFDGVDLSAADPSEVRRRIAVVPQDTVLFAGSVKENIRLGAPNASDAAVLEAAEEALVSEFVHTLPDGYDTILGERGLQLSGGQRQRIAIARAILKSPSVLLLDEATSALDTQNESLLQAGLERLMKTCTTIVIAHRLSTVFGADRIVVMDEGKIVNIGAHDELIKHGGFYAKVAALQLNNDQYADNGARIFAEN